MGFGESRKIKMGEQKEGGDLGQGGENLNIDTII